MNAPGLVATTWHPCAWRAPKARGAGPRLPAEPIARFAPAWAAVLVAVAGVLGPARLTSAQAAWELTPYRVAILLAADPSPPWSEALRADLGQQLLARVEAHIGPAWDARLVEPDDELRRALLADPKALVPEHLPAVLRDLKHADKVFLVVVHSAPDGFDVIAREFDVRTAQLGIPVAAVARQAGKLCDACYWAVSRAFAPLARVVAVERDQVTLRVRAGTLAAMRPGAPTVQPQDVLRPVLRQVDRQGKLRAVATVPWTFVTVDKVQQAEVIGTLYTGLRSALSSRRRGRVEQLALAVVAPDRPTVLRVVSRTGTQRPLAGYDIFAHAPHEKRPQWVGRTNRQGRLDISPAQPALRVLLIKHGDQVLARLPMVPGLEPELTAAIADDDGRLEGEGFVLGLEDELIDLVTQREVLMARARAKAAAGQFDEALRLLGQISALKSQEQFAREIAQQQRKIASDDPAVQKAIDARFDQTQKLVRQYLDPAPVERLTAEVSKARAAATRAQPAKSQP